MPRLNISFNVHSLKKEVENIQYKEFYTYYVYEDGRVYSTKSKKILKGEIVHGYLQYTLSINKQSKRFKAHRLVAMLFLDKPKEYDKLVVNHIDGNKKNNHYTNLEWCSVAYNNYHARKYNLNNISKTNSDRWKDKDFREKTGRHISEGLLKSGCTKWKNNGRFKYEIYDKYGKNYNRSDLSQLLQLSQSYTDALIKKYINGTTNKYFEKHGIYIKDIKSKVNRLSKSTEYEKNVS